METTDPTPKPELEPEARAELDNRPIDLDRYPVEVLEAVLKILKGRSKGRFHPPE